MTTITFTVDPDEMDELIAQELRECYVALADQSHHINFKERVPTMEAILVVLDHYMTREAYETWYETIKEL